EEQIWANLAVMRYSEIKEARLSAIGALLSHANVGIRCQAAQALGMVGPKASSQVQRLINALSDKEDPEVVGCSLIALGAIGGEPMPALVRVDQIARDSKNPALKATAEEVARAIKTGKKKAAPKGPPK